MNGRRGIVKLPALVFNDRMNMPTIQPLSYSGYRFPAVIISHCTWLYFRFALSYRDVAEMMAERGVTVSYETIREWSRKFGGPYARWMRAKRGRLGDRWHLDEVFLTINGKLQYLWRAVDQDGDVLDILVQPRRHKNVAKKFFRKLLKGFQSRPTFHRHRQAAQLRSSQGRSPAFGGASAARQAEQSGGKLPSAYSRKRVPHARLQGTRTRPAIPLCLRGGRVLLPSWPAPTSGQELPRDHAPTLRTMA